jgi:predicted dehydrogenase
MDRKISRREFVKAGTSAGLAATLAAAGQGKASLGEEKPVRIGVVGLGRRGTGLMSTLLGMDLVEVPAVCDLDGEKVSRAQALATKAGRAKPEGYSQGPEDFRRLMSRDDLDAVLIATPWHWHTPMAVCGMKSGKYVAVEVPAALTFEQCWDLVDTYEETGMPCMMLENWSFRRDNLAVLNMIRLGLLGEIVHCHCAHSHDCIDHWFFDTDGSKRWGAEYLLTRNADQYPTHSLGPVISWMDLGCGDYFDYITSTATSSLGINSYFTREFGPEHPNAMPAYKQGDIVTSVIRTVKGKTIVINYDMQLPRPYDNRWMIQGTGGIYNEQRQAVYLTGRSPEYHQWEPFAPYQEEYENAWWKQLRGREGSHGGTDYLELSRFLNAVRGKTRPPIDVYDSVLMSVIVPLSEKSIAQGSAPVKCPDFTRGAWKTRKPSFALDMYKSG